MAQCCVCGEKIGVFDRDVSISSENPALKICGTCISYLNQIKPGASFVEINLGKEYFSEYLHSPQITSPEVEKCLSDLVLYAEQLCGEKNQEAKLQKIEEDIKDSYEDQKRKQPRPPIMLTTGYDFQGYDITEYKGIVSGDVVLGTGFLSEFGASFADFFGAQSYVFAEKLRSAKQAALENLKNEIFYTCGTNAAIGLAFAYPAFRSNMIGISATATAVVLQKKGKDTVQTK